MDFDSIIIDEDVFDDSFIPERLVCREGQMKEIARCVAPVKSGKSIRNLFVYGPPGAGKTIVVKSVLRETRPKQFVYINCWAKRTIHKMLEEVLLQMGFVVHGRESASELEKKFEKAGRRLVVVFDEADLMKDQRILYSLLRNGCGVVLISNTGAFLSHLDPRIASSLLLTDLEFKPYSHEEIFQILRGRAAYGIRLGATNDSLLRIISAMAGGDARIALQILRIAARDAESKDLGSITIEEVKAAARSTRKYGLSYLLSKLNEHQQVLYEILKERGEMVSGRLYREYCRAIPNHLVDRAYRKSMTRMVELGLIKSSGKGRWRKYQPLP